MFELCLKLFIYFSLIVKSIHGKIYQCDETAICGCSVKAPTAVTGRIVGGETVTERSFTWMISLQRLGLHECGASLINKEFAITAAHCFESSTNPKHFSIVAGSNNLRLASKTYLQKRQLIAIYKHPDFNSETYENDIAIIRFLPLITNETWTLNFICLPEHEKDPFIDGNDLLAIGWGVKNFGEQEITPELQQVTVQAISSNSEMCNRSMIANPHIQFCAGVNDGGKDTCQGDSGGPLMYFDKNRWVLVGLTSFGIGCAVKGYSGLYTRVSSYTDFIEKFAKKSEPQSSNLNDAYDSTLSRDSSSISLSMSKFCFIVYFPIVFYNCLYTKCK